MAKTEKEKVYVKLGEKASSFSCPTTGFNLVTKAQVKELVPTAAASKKVIVALRGGHLVHAKPKEIEEALYNESSDDLGDVLDEAFLNTKTKATLVPMALELLEDDDEEDADDIEGMKKVELVEFILRKNETKQ